MEMYLIIGIIIWFVSTVSDKIIIVLLKDSPTFKKEKYERYLKKESFIQFIFFSVLGILLWPLMVFSLITMIVAGYYTLMFDTKTFYNEIKKARETFEKKSI